MARIPDGYVIRNHVTGLTITQNQKELVLCRHCIYMGAREDGEIMCRRHNFYLISEDNDWYCADGVRKEA